MASRTLETNNTDADDPNDVEPTKLGEDETMEAAGSNRMKNDEEMLEFNVKWQLPGHHDAMTAKKIVQELLATLLVYQPNDVTFIDTKKREWEFNEKVDEDAFMQESNQMALSVHPIKNKQKQVVRWVTITRIRSMSTIQDWKDNDHFYSAADAASAYIFPHPFPVEAWDTITIGFIKNIHAVHYPKELLHDQLYDMLTAQTQTPPPFQVIPQRITSPDKVATTKAYTIHCQKDDAAQLLHLFTHGPFRMEPNQIFVPFRYKNKNPDLFTKCIRQQNEVYHKTWIIKLEGFTTEMMRTILPELSKVNGVMHVVPSRRLHKIGEWKMLVDQTKCSYIHRQLSQVWTTIINHIPSELMKAAPPSFSVPTISSKRAREYQDTDSDEDSYGSLLSTGTTVSVMTTDDASLNEMPEEYRHPSYAAAAASSMNQEPIPKFLLLRPLLTLTGNLKNSNLNNRFAIKQHKSKRSKLISKQRLLGVKTLRINWRKPLNSLIPAMQDSKKCSRNSNN